MNRFRTLGNSLWLAGVIATLFLLLTFGDYNTAHAQSVNAKVLSESNGPLLQKRSYLYADIDTLRQRVFVFVKSGLWEFDLNKKSWTFLDSLQNRPENIREFEFGFNPVKNKLQLWSRGVGMVYTINLQNYAIERADNSFNHRNQYGHYPFYDRNGRLHAFGGYGFWNWKNIISFYNSEIDEWDIQPIVPSSPLPKTRKPYSGAFSSRDNVLYIYGGKHSKSNRQDDRYKKIRPLHDLWKFNFEQQRWSQIASFGIDTLQFHNPSDNLNIDRTNKISSSAFSPASNTWYLPFRDVNQTADIIYFKPLNVKSGRLYRTFKIAFGTARQFIPTNFFYNTKTKNLLFVGTDRLSNSEAIPIRIYTVNESTILNNLADGDERTNWLAWGGGAGILMLLVALALLFGQKKFTSPDKSASKRFSLSNIQQYDWLTEVEKELLSHLKKKQSFSETHEIETLLWPDIGNYDYRRRLRNDIIKSINKKVRTHTSAEEKLITIKTDPTDRRKNLYGINPSFR